MIFLWLIFWFVTLFFSCMTASILVDPSRGQTEYTNPHIVSITCALWAVAICFWFN